MPEIRKDLLSGRKVVVATERSKRPHKLMFELKGGHDDVSDCPFCDGHEEMTPPEVFSIGRKENKPDTPGWKVRVVPNKYPAFSKEDGPTIEKGFFQRSPAIGEHEVIIHSKDHFKNFGELEEGQISDIFAAMRQRMTELCTHEYIKHVSIIVNHRPEAGASLPHPHSQIFAAPIVPPVIDKELRQFKDYADKNNGDCLLCSQMKAEKKEGLRVFNESENFITVAPYASRFPYEMLVVPRKHKSNFLEITDEENGDLSKSISMIFRAYYNKLQNPPYNLLLHSAPCSETGIYHWHIETVPRINLIAGFELASGMMINIVAPEHAVTFLKS